MTTLVTTWIDARVCGPDELFLGSLITYSLSRYFSILSSSRCLLFHSQLNFPSRSFLISYRVTKEVKLPFTIVFISVCYAGDGVIALCNAGFWWRYLVELRIYSRKSCDVVWNHPKFLCYGLPNFWRSGKICILDILKKTRTRRTRPYQISFWSKKEERNISSKTEWPLGRSIFRIFRLL